MLPDIAKIIAKWSHKPPVIGNIQTYKSIWLRGVPNERELAEAQVCWQITIF